MVPARKNNRDPGLGQESEGGASEGIFLAGENPRVLTQLTPIAVTFENERYGGAATRRHVSACSEPGVYFVDEISQDSGSFLRAETNIQIDV
jgi:hypothetical protein